MGFTTRYVIPLFKSETNVLILSIILGGFIFIYFYKMKHKIAEGKEKYKSKEPTTDTPHQNGISFNL